MSASKFDFLKRRQAEREQAEPEAGRPAPPAGRGETPGPARPGARQYGRRAAAGYAQVNANIPAELRRALRVKLAAEGRTMQEVLEELIRAYVEAE